MGYNIIQLETKFSLPQNMESKALLSLQELCLSGIYLRWINNNEVLEATSLQEALRSLRWEFIRGKYEYNKLSLFFTGEKIGNDKEIFLAIAAFVNDGSYITFKGEDGRMWKYVFNNGKLIVQHAEISITWKEQTS